MEEKEKLIETIRNTGDEKALHLINVFVQTLINRRNSLLLFGEGINDSLDGD